MNLALVNSAAGSARDALDALEALDDCHVTEAPPDEMADILREAVQAGASRVLVAGGDGTIAAAAGVLAGTDTALAIVPAGTLNHFAKDNGIPVAAGDAARLGRGGRVISADVGYVNGRVFLNTSSVGAYVTFVRARERLERRFSYRVASVLAAARLVGRLRSFTVQVEVEGVVRRYRTALVFIGVGERELQLPVLGGRVKDGKRVLHVIVVRGTSRARLIALALAGLVRGLRHIARTPWVDSFLVDHCRVEPRRSRGTISVDGELAVMDSPLEYHIERDALKIVVPDERRAPSVERRA